MKTLLLSLLAAGLGLTVLRAEESGTVEFPSPDGQFAVRTTDGKDQLFRDLIEQKTGRVLVDMDGPFRRVGLDPLLWSSDSRWAAYANHGGRLSDTRVLCWDGTGFQRVELPELPDPVIKWRPTLGRRGAAPKMMRTYDSEVPLRWLKPGVLVVELVGERYRLENGDQFVNYTRRFVYTVRFNAKTLAGSILKVVREKQKVEVSR